MTLKRKQLKNELKHLAVLLRTGKLAYKEYQRTNVWKTVDGYTHLTYWEYRHKHVAASLLRGTPMEKIEVRKKESTPKLDQKLVDQYVAEYGVKDEQAA